jgi:hypothetical protein
MLSPAYKTADEFAGGPNHSELIKVHDYLDDVSITVRKEK